MTDPADVTRFKRPTGFVRWERPKSPSEYITIYTSGSIRLPPNLLDELGDPTHFAFLHDAARKRIALEPADETNPDAYPVRTFKGGVTRMVTARAFLNSIGQPLRGRHPAVVEGGLIVAYLAALEAEATK